MKSGNVLAFDFGASSGRAMIAGVKDGKIFMEEIHRFSNDPVMVRGCLYWDVLRLFHEIKQGITAAVNSGYGFDCIGIDTWGVDFGLIDEKGNLLANPVNYRDLRNEPMPAEVDKIISKKDLYARNGLQRMAFNTVYQLYYLAKYEPELLARTDKMLFMPDLFAYFLTGKKRMEHTIASTSGFINPKTRKPDSELLSMLKIPESILPEMINPAESYGELSAEICEELHCNPVPVFAVATHDTASAVAATPTFNDDYIYISCGTWSLFGTVLDKPVLDEQSAEIGFTNEGAYDGKIRYLKNIMGLWLIQQSRQEWKRQGLNVSFDDMENAAKAAEPFKCFVNPDDPMFSLPGNMPKRVQKYCSQTGQYVPKDMGEILRCIYQSLAMKYKLTFEHLQKISGKKYDCIHMIGGGIKDQLLCSMTAAACGVSIKAGPVEATVTGNVLVLMKANGLIKDYAQGKKLVVDGTEIKEYKPCDSDVWQANYENAVNAFNANNK